MNHFDWTTRCVVMIGSPVRAGLAVAVMCVVIAVCFRLMSTLRDYVAQDQQTAADVLANLDEMRQRGDISEEEFRTIQSRAERLENESSNDSTVTPPSSSSESV